MGRADRQVGSRGTPAASSGTGPLDDATPARGGRKKRVQDRIDRISKEKGRANRAGGTPKKI